MKGNVRLMRFCVGLIFAISAAGVLFGVVGFVGFPDMSFDSLLEWMADTEPSMSRRLLMIREGYNMSIGIGFLLMLALIVIAGLSAYLYSCLKPKKDASCS